MRSLPLALALSLLLAGCPRQLERDSGPPEEDSGEDPGNPFDGPIVLDDARVRGLDPTRLRAADVPCREPVLVRVYRVVDGDTIDVRGEDVVLDVPVRLIGIDTPEIAHPPEPADCYGDEARDFTAQLQGRLVWLTFDNTCWDGFSRLLAYVHIGAGDGDLWQRQLLRRGFATVLTVGGNRTYASVFERDEASAAMAGAGLWSACF